MTTVVNLKDASSPEIVHVGRESGLLGQGGWGNPWTHRTHGTAAQFRVKTREEAIERYRARLWELLDGGRNEALMEDLADLHGRTLGCWCKPQACHGDVLAKAADWAYNELLARGFGP